MANKKAPAVNRGLGATSITYPTCNVLRCPLQCCRLGPDAPISEPIIPIGRRMSPTAIRPAARRGCGRLVCLPDLQIDLPERKGECEYQLPDDDIRSAGHVKRALKKYGVADLECGRK